MSGLSIVRCLCNFIFIIFFFSHIFIYESESEAAQSCPTLCDPIDCSVPGSSIHGIFQARVLEWGAIVFSDLFVNIIPIHISLGNEDNV